ncbi:hypothetical protein OBE_14771, partial [human gut metagenome]
LKQPLYQPKSDAEQVVLLTLAAHGVLDEIKTVELRQKTSAFVLLIVFCRRQNKILAPSKKPP